MTKERFIEGYGVPLYTVGVGGSGGAIQQYVYAQRHPGVIIDAAIPQYSYSDMVTQTIHVGDCELLEHYMDVTDGANPKWAVWPNRTWLEGLNASATRPNPYRGGAPGNSECVNGWRGLTPLALNPHFGTAGAGSEFYDPAVIAAVKWTHWDDLRNVYGVGANGYARVPSDNVGVQYGLQALNDGNITPAEFLKLNATVGSWKETSDMVQEGCPFFPARLHQPAPLRPVEPPQHAAEPRRRRDARTAARGRHGGRERRLHVRDRLPRRHRHPDHRLAALPRGRARHAQLAPVVRVAQADAEPRRRGVEPGDLVHGRTAGARLRPDAAGARGDRRVAGEHRGRSRGAASAATSPAAAVDSCFATERLAAPLRQRRRGTGILDTRPAGPCTQAFPLFSTSRIVAGGPIEGSIFKCALKPVATAVTRRHVRAVDARARPTSTGSSRSSRPGSATTRSRRRAAEGLLTAVAEVAGLPAASAPAEG